MQLTTAPNGHARLSDSMAQPVTSFDGKRIVSLEWLLFDDAGVQAGTGRGCGSGG